jgi:hypothetical protein
VYESAGVLSVFLNQQDAIDYATGQEANKFSSISGEKGAIFAKKWLVDHSSSAYWFLL